MMCSRLHPHLTSSVDSASRVEAELKEQQREKAASLRRFQGEVKQRVNQQVRMRRKQQLQKSYEAAERESSIAVQYSDSALRLTPRKNTCLFRSCPVPPICGPGACASLAQQQGMPSEPFLQQATQLSKTMRQVRRRLASCKTVSQGTGSPRLPGGVWRQEKPESCKTSTMPAADENEELLLTGHHDLPAELQDQRTDPHRAEHDDDFYIKTEFEKFCDGSVKDPSSPEPPQRPHTNYPPPLLLWDGVDQEETKKQRKNEYLRYRRLFMSIEREQVREQQRQRERQKRIAEIKSKKENERRVEEKRMQEMTEQPEPTLGMGACETLARLKLEERRGKKTKENQQRNKEHVRYIEALRAQIREKIKLCNIDLPPLCFCGSDFWDSHPDTCANNCVFYKNHKAYSRALQSLISSCAPMDRTPSARLPFRDLAVLCARLGQPRFELHLSCSDPRVLGRTRCTGPQGLARVLGTPHFPPCPSGSCTASRSRGTAKIKPSLSLEPTLLVRVVVKEVRGWCGCMVRKRGPRVQLTEPVLDGNSLMFKEF
ncbi:trichohyalin-like isoform X4 [Phaenicophaeus curvirostris]|uniref:trichohyalin-like isoform X4 n=1 Tax=Phaenicophaeus curvirostris TaxID=33595 RepID=UPI0037F0BDBA